MTKVEFDVIDATIIANLTKVSLYIISVKVSLVAHFVFFNSI